MSALYANITGKKKSLDILDIVIVFHANKSVDTLYKETVNLGNMQLLL